VYNLERLYCAREGHRRQHDVLPARLMEEPLPGGPAAGMVIDRQMMDAFLDAYFNFRGWDQASGIPTADRLRQLGLEEFVADFWHEPAREERSAL
jgi:aldehyde:ferredoxin oxidoreductase